MKSRKVTLILAFFLGGVGGHRFYVNKIGTGVLWLLTGGLFGIGATVDFIMICQNKFRDKDGIVLLDDCPASLVHAFVAIIVVVCVLMLFMMMLMLGL